jgi:hypothetical protein
MGVGEVGLFRWVVGCGGVGVFLFMAEGLSPDVNMGSDDPVNRDAAVAAAATLRRVPRTSMLLAERAEGGSGASFSVVSKLLDAGAKSPPPDVSVVTMEDGSLSDPFSAFKEDEVGVLFASTVELVPESMLGGRGIKAESLFLAPAAVSPM